MHDSHEGELSVLFRVQEMYVKKSNQSYCKTHYESQNSSHHLPINRVHIQLPPPPPPPPRKQTPLRPRSLSPQKPCTHILLGKTHPSPTPPRSTLTIAIPSRHPEPAPMQPVLLDASHYRLKSPPPGTSFPSPNSTPHTHRAHRGPRRSPSQPASSPATTSGLQLFEIRGERCRVLHHAARLLRLFFVSPSAACGFWMLGGL